MFSLRPYQSRADRQITSALDAHDRVCYQAPTGSGKTVLFCARARHEADRGRMVCILVHRRELLRQASRSLTAEGVHHSVIAPGYTPVPALVTVASKDTLTRRDGHEWDLLIIDEGHHATADTYGRIIASARKVLAVTATPCRLSGRGLGTIFEHLITGPSVRELIRDGYLSPYKYYAPPSQVDASQLRSQAGDYRRDDVERAMMSRTITGNAVEHYMRHLNGAPAIAFCCSVDHAKQVAEEFRAVGFRADSVDGTLDQDTRDARLAALGNGGLNVLTSCALIDEGLDIPGVAGIIDLYPTKSLSRYLQRVGRALRVAPGKTHAVILDHVGNVHRHGLPDMDRTWSLDKGAEKSQSAACADQVRQCPMCYYAHTPAPSCPNCAYEYPVAEKRKPKYRDGTLSEITADQIPADFLQTARTLDQFHVFAKAKGYSPGWAWHKFKQFKKRARSA